MRGAGEGRGLGWRGAQYNICSPGVSAFCFIVPALAWQESAPDRVKGAFSPIPSLVIVPCATGNLPHAVCRPCAKGGCCVLILGVLVGAAHILVAVVRAWLCVPVPRVRRAAILVCVFSPWPGHDFTVFSPLVFDSTGNVTTPGFLDSFTITITLP